MTQVSDLLAESWAAHLRSRAPNKGRRPEGWRDMLREARDKREQAHSIDPLHQDAAWKEEQTKTGGGYDTHREMLRFYYEVLGDA